MMLGRSETVIMTLLVQAEDMPLDSSLWSTSSRVNAHLAIAMMVVRVQYEQDRTHHRSQAGSLWRTILFTPTS